MRRNPLSFFIYVFVACLLLPAPVAAQNDSAGIKAMLKARDVEIKRLLGPEGQEISKARKEELRLVINDLIDFSAMGRAAIGPHWDGLTPAQQSEFVEVFSDIVRGQSLGNLDPYRAAVTYDAVTVNGETAHVETTTVYKDTPMKVEYLLVRTESVWRATDVILDEVGTVDGYSRSFQTMIRKKGFEELMTRLRTRRDSLASNL